MPRHPRTRHFIRWLLTNGYREQPRHPDNAAHLHLNLEKPTAATAWVSAFGRLRSSNWKTQASEIVMAPFFPGRGRRPEAVYSRLGFSVFDRKSTTIFQPEIQRAGGNRLRAQKIAA